ncbi:hypothetical protein AM587_10005621 [Phytophthora nicotianae]|uniref:J domain-containing protein n=2 Tax=Phytophthora nicotianae TaxID=4792 RepID=A0A0W8DYR2_PHYNI|nr:hypothetical protein F444_14739 [Phytophthora nicotianae P1976]KUG01551.1 hypothetical protein AM587_10005621 [Phytophthora nicotianae]
MVKASNAPCGYVANYEYNGMYYCTIHYRVARNASSSETAKQCEGMRSGNVRCRFISRKQYKGKTYCGNHLNKAIKEDNKRTNDVPPASARPNPFRFDSPPRSSGSPGFGGSSRPSNSRGSSGFGSFKAKSVQLPSPTKPLTQEEQDFFDNVNMFLTSRLDPAELKKRGRSILLKIHPDKYRSGNLDAKTITQFVLKHMSQA